ncbi:MAG: thioredoxin family protein [Flavobacteriaceae bacterium]|nr:TM0996/MTH895 family glutaredoxin-like protein [Bacteroidia bacterium]NNK81940.1 thioredoxin family protein [Flavobacteriaceae bacterium]
MKRIKILGTGCAKCVSTDKIVKEVVNEEGIDAKVEKVEDIMQIMEYNVLNTPAIVIDEKVVLSGKVPSKTEVKALLVDNFASTACCSDETTDDSCCSTDEKASGCC